MTYREPGREMTAEEKEDRAGWLSCVLEEYLKGVLVAADRDAMPERWWPGRLPELVRFLLSSAGDDGRVEMQRMAMRRTTVLTIRDRDQYSSLELDEWMIERAKYPYDAVWSMILAWVDAWTGRAKP